MESGLNIGKKDAMSGDTSSVSALSFGAIHERAFFTRTGELRQIEVIGNSIRAESIKF